MKREWKPRVSKHITLREPLACGDCSDSAVSSFEQPMRKTPAKNVLLSNLFTIYEHRTSRMPSKWVGYVSMYNVVAWSWNYRYFSNKYFYDWNLLTISCLQNDNICIVAHHVEMFERVQQLKDRFHSSKFLHDMVRYGAVQQGKARRVRAGNSKRERSRAEESDRNTSTICVSMRSSPRRHRRRPGPVGPPPRWLPLTAAERLHPTTTGSGSCQVPSSDFDCPIHLDD